MLNSFLKEEKGPVEKSTANIPPGKKSLNAESYRGGRDSSKDRQGTPLRHQIYDHDLPAGLSVRDDRESQSWPTVLTERAREKGR